jgi:hypothetical protein
VVDMKMLWPAALFAFGFACSALAEGLEITGPGTTGWWPAQEPERQVVLGLLNHGVSDPIYGWELALEVVPTAGGQGPIEITPLGSPNNYIFGTGGSPLYSSPTLPGDPTTFSDYMVGSAVTAPSASNLVAFGLRASPGASGQFDLVADCGEFYSAWHSTAPPDARAFDNLPFNGSTVTLGSVVVHPVPEPCGLLLAGAAVGLALYFTAAHKYGRMRRGA